MRLVFQAGRRWRGPKPLCRLLVQVLDLPSSLQLRGNLGDLGLVFRDSNLNVRFSFSVFFCTFSFYKMKILQKIDRVFGNVY